MLPLTTLLEVLALLTPDAPRPWPRNIPGLGQPPASLADLDELRRQELSQEEVNNALLAPRLLPWLDAERKPLEKEPNLRP